MQLVVVSAVRKAVSAATTIFTAISIKRAFFIVIRNSFQFLSPGADFCARGQDYFSKNVPWLAKNTRGLVIFCSWGIFLSILFLNVSRSALTQ